VYRLETNQTVARLLERRVRVANSIAFSPAGDTMYFCDSPTRNILAFPYDDVPGEPRVFYKMTREAEGFPDGATVDSAGGLWSAQFGASRVVRHRPEDGIIDTVVEVPVPNVTCCALGGPNLTTLYITTTRRKMSEDELASQPEAGSLFAVDVPIQGLPEPEVILRA